ncbi:ER membrane protein complex subunit 7-like, partial [Carlito syrichta]|uniref:Endoplasmic reticulum membrane protein complex subunit 7 n=1 Tax=Carlito syrichta TaxID=1868482 RepID=A0A3Q0DV29_CARSF
VVTLNRQQVVLSQLLTPEGVGPDRNWQRLEMDACLRAQAGDSWWAGRLGHRRGGSNPSKCSLKELQGLKWWIASAPVVQCATGSGYSGCRAASALQWLSSPQQCPSGGNGRAPYEEQAAILGPQPPGREPEIHSFAEEVAKYDFHFSRTDGSFVVHDIPSGSYVVEVISPAYRFDPVRVDITSKGKMRARYVNYIKTSEVVRLPYPLQMKSSGPPSYFIKRESWGWTDFLMNPMVMMMVLPLLIFVLLPKVVNTSDPDMRREMEQSMNMLNSNHELPDVSEFMTRLFSSKSSGKSSSGSSKTGKSGAGKRR